MRHPHLLTGFFQSAHDRVCRTVPFNGIKRRASACRHSLNYKKRLKTGIGCSDQRTVAGGSLLPETTETTAVAVRLLTAAVSTARPDCLPSRRISPFSSCKSAIDGLMDHCTLEAGRPVSSIAESDVFSPTSSTTVLGVTRRPDLPPDCGPADTGFAERSRARARETAIAEVACQRGEYVGILALGIRIAI
jgi:hypothetical protein